MDLILWRHCDAESGPPDALRRLTPRGRTQAQRMARWLAPRLPDDCRILVSPAVRAQQTAHALRRPFQTVPELAPGASVEAVLRVIDWPAAGGTTVIVGHEPTLGHVAAYLLSGDGSGSPLDKGAVVWLAQRRHDGAGAALEVAIRPDAVPA